MKIFRFRIIDILALQAVVGLVISAYVVGFRLRVPHFLTGDIDSYFVSEIVGAELKSWHQLPPQSMRERIFQLAPAEEYAILQIGGSSSGPQIVTKRIRWLLLLYDISIATLALMFTIIVSRHFRSVKQAT